MAGGTPAGDRADAEAAAEYAPAGTSSAAAIVAATRSFDRMLTPIRSDLPPWLFGHQVPRISLPSHRSPLATRWQAAWPASMRDRRRPDLQYIRGEAPEP